MPFYPERYPKNWKQISLAIRERAGNRCEECGAPNGETIIRDLTGRWRLEKDVWAMQSDDGEALFGLYPKPVRIVLTVHHECEEPSCSDQSHMKALCQKDHLRADGKMHGRHSAETRRNKRYGLQLRLELEEAKRWHMRSTNH